MQCVESFKTGFNGSFLHLASRTEHYVEIYFCESDRNRMKYYGKADVCFFNCTGAALILAYLHREFGNDVA